LSIFFDDLGCYGDRAALIGGAGELFTFGELVDNSSLIAASVPSRSFVFLVCQNHPVCVFAYVGFLRKRVVPLLLNYTISDGQLLRLIGVYLPSYIFIQRDRVSDFLGDYVEVGGFLGGYVLLCRRDGFCPLLYDELGLVLTTSGSTGSPRLVRLSYQNIQINTESIIDYLNITADERAITTMPMSYSYGLSIINTHLCAGGSIIMTDLTLMDRGFWNLFNEFLPTTFGGVPYIYEMLRKLRFGRMRLSGLRYLTQAGGHLSAELVGEFRDICAGKSIRFVVMYGQTEATARMSYLPFDKSYEKAGSIGIPIPNGQFKLEDEEGNIINSAESAGELVYYGPNVSLGYAEEMSDLAKEDENGGVLKTGDIAKRDSDGYYYIIGRKKRFLKIFGNRINLDEVDQILKNAGYDAITTGKDDQLKIFTTQNCEDKIKSLLTEQLKLNQSAFKIQLIKNIPRNDNGKILYNNLPE
jgi:acyl-coenzyme A synthetase/AMP-(fatty) acid ligase